MARHLHSTRCSRSIATPKTTALCVGQCDLRAAQRLGSRVHLARPPFRLRHTSPFIGVSCSSLSYIYTLYYEYDISIHIIYDNSDGVSTHHPHKPFFPGAEGLFVHSCGEQPAQEVLMGLHSSSFVWLVYHRCYRMPTSPLKVTKGWVGVANEFEPLWHCEPKWHTLQLNPPPPKHNSLSVKAILTSFILLFQDNSDGVSTHHPHKPFFPSAEGLSVHSCGEQPAQEVLMGLHSSSFVWLFYHLCYRMPTSPPCACASM